MKTLHLNLKRKWYDMKDSISILILAIKYWMQGDNWEFAINYATNIVKGFRK